MYTIDMLKPFLVPQLHTVMSCQDEAFALWKQQWGRLYPDESKSRQVIDLIHNSYYLVNLVDNNYVGGNRLWEILDKVISISVVEAAGDATTNGVTPPSPSD
jgi:methylenetetrahydrofolate reductase (NADPH)